MENLKEFYQSEKVDAVTIGKVIMLHRKEKQLSQEIFSGLSGIGRTHFAQMERGDRKPSYKEFTAMCETLSVKPSAILEEIKKALSSLED